MGGVFACSRKKNKEEESYGFKQYSLNFIQGYLY